MEKRFYAFVLLFALVCAFLLFSLLRQPVASHAELAALFLPLAFAIAYTLYAHRQHRQEIAHLAYIEPVTGLHNERWLEQALQKIADSGGNTRGRLYLAATRAHLLGFFRSTYARAALVKTFIPKVRELADTRPWCKLCAISNDRSSIYFLCDLPEGMPPADAAQDMAKNGEMVLLGGIMTRVHYHTSFLALPQGSFDPPRQITNLRAGLDLAEQENHNFILYDQPTQERLELESRIEKLAPEAMALEEFKVWYQPKYDLFTQKLVGAESLVRWQSPDLGFLMPGQFIPHFERTGFAVKLDYYMLDHVARFLKNRLQKGLPIVPVAVNQSALHMTESGYLDRMQQIAAQHALPPGTLDLEITETAFVDFKTKDARDNSRHIIDTLQNAGYATSMDDFCTGYSSIAMLQNLPMGTMKIDRSILLAAENSQRAALILKNVIKLGTDLGMHVLCEGVETAAQESMLKAFGCGYAQGFLYARPMPEEDFVAFMEERLG